MIKVVYLKSATLGKVTEIIKNTQKHIATNKKKRTQNCVRLVTLYSLDILFIVRDVLALILLFSISYLLLCSWRRFARLRRLPSHITACLRNQRTTCVLAPTKKTDTKLCPPFLLVRDVRLELTRSPTRPLNVRVCPFRQSRIAYL